MTLTYGSIEGKQLNLCRDNIIFCHADSFCLQEKKEDEKRSISDSDTEAIASAMKLWQSP